MPIEGFYRGQGFTKGGSVRTGEKVPSRNGSERPAALDYFKFDPDPVDEKLIAAYREIYGEKPQKLYISFPSNDINTVFSYNYTLFGQSGMKCQGNGKTARRVHDEEWIDVDCPTPAECEFCGLTKDGKPQCKPHGYLQFFIKGIPTCQVFTYSTNSVISIANILNGLELLQNVRGRLAGIWVCLQMTQRAVRPEGKKKDVWVVDLSLPYSIDALMEGASAGALALPEASAPAAEPADAPAPSSVAPEPAPPVATRKSLYEQCCDMARTIAPNHDGKTYVGALIKKENWKNLREVPVDWLESLKETIRELATEAMTQRSAPAVAVPAAKPAEDDLSFNDAFDHDGAPAADDDMPFDAPEPLGAATEELEW